MTVYDELSNRNRCRVGLRGVLVSLDGTGPPEPVTDTRWEETGRLSIGLFGKYVDAKRCVLASPWPVRCCSPRRTNQWNAPQGSRNSGPGDSGA